MTFLLAAVLLGASLCGELVEKRGFIIEGQEGRLFLSNTPNLPSCCLMKKEKAIELIGFSKSSPYSSITVKGYLKETEDGLKLFAE